MSRRLIGTIMLVMIGIGYASAINWSEITSSKEYYYGSGVGATEEEAYQAALADMSSQIAVTVQSTFTQVDDLTAGANGAIDQTSKVLNCVKTYSNASLKNVQHLEPIGKAPKITMRVYMLRSEMDKVFADRAAKAKDLVSYADGAMAKNKIDIALQYYYWGYSLIRSIPDPLSVKDDNGKILVNRLPIQIDDVLSGIKVTATRKEGSRVDLQFTYDGKPISNLDFIYNDGKSEVDGRVNDGRGMIELSEGYNPQVYHLDVEYQYISQARGDSEMEGVLATVVPKSMKHAEVKVASVVGTSVAEEKPTPTPAPVKPEDSNVSTAQVDVPQGAPSAEVSEFAKHQQMMEGIVSMIQNRNYSSNFSYFTQEGREVFDALIRYGQARIVSNPGEFSFHKGADGRVTARGLQMSFSFNNKGRKRTFTENVVFTFDTDVKIENVAFGIGKVAEDDILNKRGVAWKPETRETIVQFLENYKTAYALKRYDFIEGIFDDEARIMVGTVMKRATPQQTRHKDMVISQFGQQQVTYTKMNKAAYLDRIKRIFERNEFINIKFTHNDVRWLEKFSDKEYFAIEIGQEYTSSTYSDSGYLFLLVNMTDRENPLIRVRTWQPSEVGIDNIMHEGFFFE